MPAKQSLDPEFVALLRCPLCPQRPPLLPSECGGVLNCPCERRRSFPIVDGIPDLRPDDQRAPAPAAHQEF